jgi:ADP-heptose:LPS heptosyltransferase
MTPRVVALRVLGLGDLLTAVPALRALADAHPGHRRVLVTTAPMAGLARLTGAVDEVVPALPLRRVTGVAEGPEVVVNLHGRGPESHRVALALRPGRLVAWHSADAEVAGPRWRADEHEVARWCRLLAESGIPADPSRLALDVEPDPDAAGATVIHPGAADAARRWPAERFAAVARRERRAGRRVLVTGGPDERGLATAVAEAAGIPERDVLAGRTDPVALARIVAGAGRLVCGDTGVAHVATAVGTPSVVLFGPVSPARWGPPRADGRHIALWAGRTGDPHARRPDPGLLRIGAGEVLAALDRVASFPSAATGYA